jgi:signal transduction histidine kinase
VRALQEQLDDARRQGEAHGEAPGVQLGDGRPVSPAQLQVLQRQAAIGSLTAMMVHEFNNILTPMINYAALAKQNPDLTDKALHWAHEGGLRASHICQAIQGIFRRETGPNRSGPIHRLVHETIEATARPPEKDQIDLAVSIPEDLEAAVPAAELQLVMLNLYTNARRAVLQSGGIRRILVTGCRQSDGVLMKVVDSGCGLGGELGERIFEPFFTTTDPGDIKHRGGGLGLTVCRHIVSSWPGRIWADGEQGHGTAFFVQMPG